METHVLILGGTTEAGLLADALVKEGANVTTSLVGLTAKPRELPGAVRTGGFGGAEGLARWMRDHDVDRLVDATHPFAETMSWHAVDGARMASVPIVRLARRRWTPEPGDRWIVVADMSSVTATLEESARVFLSTGRRHLDPVEALPDKWFLVRAVDPPDVPVPQNCQILCDRGPFTLDGELALFEKHRIDTLVTKNSGGPAAAPKLAAARRLGCRVVLITRPPSPDGVATVDEALAWCVSASPRA